MITLPSDTLPAGKDGVIALGVNLLGEAFLASTKLYENTLDAWCAVDQGILFQIETVANYMFINVTKSDVSNCYVIESNLNNGACNMLCVNAKYSEIREFDVYFRDISPFFMFSTRDQVNYSLINYISNEDNILHYRNYKEILSIYKSKISKTK